VTDIAICAQHLTKKYADRTVVDRFDLTVPSGIVLSLLGPNGAGKTTIVRMLTTLARPTSGTATVFGRDIRTRPDAVRLVTSLTGQFAALEDNLTAQENLLLMARLRGYGPAAARRMAGQLADRLDLGPFRGQVVKFLSGGQRPPGRPGGPAPSTDERSVGRPVPAPWGFESVSWGFNSGLAAACD
jgi:ABC-type multidrug transport system ATPase subunit